LGTEGDGQELRQIVGIAALNPTMLSETTLAVQISAASDRHQAVPLHGKRIVAR
jgi:hypothetical protein